jgi:glycosyltransferase involved in cell wall biosynthesis
VRRNNKDAEIFNCPEAINPAFFSQKWKKDKIKKDSIVFIGSLIKRKGIEELVKSINILHSKGYNYSLKIIGSGSKRSYERIKKIAGSHVELKGHCTAPVIAQNMAKAKFFVLPSYIENSPNSLLEAMATGTPSIASSAGGISSLVDDYKTGFLLKEISPYSIAEKVMELHNRWELLCEVSKNSRKFIFENNYPGVVAEIILKTYKNIIADDRKA